MKYVKCFMLLLASLPLSCASRTAAVVSVAPPPESPHIIEPDGAVELDAFLEPDDPFERAIWNVKRNTPLVEKYFETDVAAGVGINVKGKCIFDEIEFIVHYDIEAAEKSDTGYFNIPFLAEDTRSGAFRTDELEWKPVSDKTGVLLSFDDDYAHVWRRYFDLFDDFGATVTFFVNGAAGAPEENDLTAFCLEAQRRGHCIGYHTVHHYDLTSISRTVFNRETIEAAQGFRDLGIPLNAFAYPYGFSRDWMHEALAPHFQFTRGFGARLRLYDAGSLPAHTIAKSIDNIQYPDDAEFERHIWLIFLSAKLLGSRIVPLATHDISDKASWGIKPQRLAYMLQTAAEFKMCFYTY